VLIKVREPLAQSDGLTGRPFAGITVPFRATSSFHIVSGYCTLRISLPAEL
jgi:hypothetical protein